jgi:hypothetical protein
VTTVYISIGNSDDKLTQAQWALFYSEACLMIQGLATCVHGQWVSEPASAWQNACWGIDIYGEKEKQLCALLSELAGKYRQDAIAWAEANTSFILPS